MKAIRQTVHGKMLMEAGHAVLLLQEVTVTPPATESVVLRYAFVRQGVETPILPAFVLDDWGSEIRGLEVYNWVEQYGDQFPRAELFGFELDGSETQCFLRELELRARLHCYAYRAVEAPLAAGVMVEAILLPDDSAATPQRIKRPGAIPQPLRSIQASWWLVKPPVTSLWMFFD